MDGYPLPLLSLFVSEVVWNEGVACERLLSNGSFQMGYAYLFLSIGVRGLNVKAAAAKADAAFEISI